MKKSIGKAAEMDAILNIVQQLCLTKVRLAVNKLLSNSHQCFPAQHFPKGLTLSSPKSLYSSWSCVRSSHHLFHHHCPPVNRIVHKSNHIAKPGQPVLAHGVLLLTLTKAFFFFLTLELMPSGLFFWAELFSALLLADPGPLAPIFQRLPPNSSIAWASVGPSNLPSS